MGTQQPSAAPSVLVLKRVLTKRATCLGGWEKVGRKGGEMKLIGKKIGGGAKK